MAAGAFLECGEHLAEVEDLFLINPANTDFVLGKTQRRVQSSTRPLPLLMFALVVVLVACPLSTALTATQNQLVIWVLVLVLVVAVPGGYGVVRAYQNYQRDLRLDLQGKLLQATITGVSTRERTEAAQTAVSLLQIGVLILDIISMFSGGNTSNSGSVNNDFYELSILYKVTTPTGRGIEDVAARNRPDLRTTRLPEVGESVLLLYVDDANFKVM
jgi:hypothetical protein